MIGMSEAILVAIVTGAFALAGTLYTAKKTNDKLVAELAKNSELSDAKLKGEINVMTQRLDDLTREVREHNGFAKKIPVLEERISDCHHRISELRDDRK